MILTLRPPFLYHPSCTCILNPAAPLFCKPSYSTVHPQGATLLADAEPGKDLAEHLLNVDRARDLPERPDRVPELLASIDNIVRRDLCTGGGKSSVRGRVQRDGGPSAPLVLRRAARARRRTEKATQRGEAVLYVSDSVNVGSTCACQGTPARS